MYLQFEFGSGGYGDPGLLAAFLGILQGIIDGLIYAIAAAFQLVGLDIVALAEGAIFSFAGLSAVGAFLSSFFRILLQGLEHIIVDLFHGRLLQVIQDIIDLLKKLRNLIAPLLRWLQKLQQIQRQLQMQTLRKFIDLIQRARKILVVFRLLHLKFAQKLDLYLARLEGDVGAKWAKLIAHMNAITGVLDLVLDPRGLLRPGHALASVGAMIGALEGAAGALGLRDLLCLGPDAPAQPIAEPWPVTEARVTSEIQTHTGDYALYERQRDDALRQYAIDLGVTSIV